MILTKDIPLHKLNRGHLSQEQAKESAWHMLKNLQKETLILF
mgnify:FL=1